MELSRQQKIAYGIIGVLAVVFAGALVYLQLIPGGGVPSGEEAPTAGGGLQPEAVSEQFDTTSVTDPRYEDLDRSLFDQGRLPVPVPPVRGRPNLF